VYKRGGEDALVPQSTEPRPQPRETPVHIKERVIAPRKKHKLCSLKLHWRLEKEGVRLHHRAIGKILKREGFVRQYRIKRLKYKYLRAERKPGDLLETDVKHVPGEVLNKAYYQYTAIDCRILTVINLLSGSFNASLNAADYSIIELPLLS
jgi:hypothetical protein